MKEGVLLASRRSSLLVICIGKALPADDTSHRRLHFKYAQLFLEVMSLVLPRAEKLTESLKRFFYKFNVKMGKLVPNNIS